MSAVSTVIATVACLYGIAAVAVSARSPRAADVLVVTSAALLVLALLAA